MDTRSVGNPGAKALANNPTTVAKESVKASQIKNVGDTREKTPLANDAEKEWNVQISPEAQELAAARRKAMDVAKKTSPIREERVAELKKRIEEGSYQMDSGKIADGIMTEAIKDHLAMRPEDHWERE